MFSTVLCSMYDILGLDEETAQAQAMSDMAYWLKTRRPGLIDFLANLLEPEFGDQ